MIRTIREAEVVAFVDQFAGLVLRRCSADVSQARLRRRQPRHRSSS